MITPPSPFRYFRDPHHFSCYKDGGERCLFCGLVRPGYGGPIPEFNTDGFDFICEVCLLEGRLAEVDLTANRGEDLRPDIGRHFPELSETELEVLTQARIVELEQRTPTIKGWYLFGWPSHCGDFCCYIKEVGQLDMHRLSPDGNGQAFLDSLLDADIWEWLRPDAPEDNSVEHLVGLYLFQCLECAKYRVGYRLGI